MAAKRFGAIACAVRFRTCGRPRGRFAVAAAAFVAGVILHADPARALVVDPAARGDARPWRIVDAPRAGDDGRGAPSLRVAAATYTPRKVEGGIGWHARWVLAPEAAERLRENGEGVIEFAVALPAGERIEASDGVEPLFASEKLIGVRVAAAAIPVTVEASRATVVLELVQPIEDFSRPFVLGAPVTSGNGVEIIDGELEASPGLRVELEPSAGFERRVGSVAAHGTSHAAREHARRLTGFDQRLSGTAIYVRGDDERTWPLRGRFVSAQDLARRSLGIVVTAFAAIVAVLLFVLRRLRSAASVERADAILASEIDRAAAHASSSPGDPERPPALRADHESVANIGALRAE